MLYVYGRFMNRQLTVTVSADRHLARLFIYFLRYHTLICYSLYIGSKRLGHPRPQLLIDARPLALPCSRQGVYPLAICWFAGP
jgi:hypothetical protein